MTPSTPPPDDAEAYLPGAEQWFSDQVLAWHEGAGQGQTLADFLGVSPGQTPYGYTRSVINAAFRRATESEQPGA